MTDTTKVPEPAKSPKHMHEELPEEHHDPLIRSLHGLIRICVKFLAILMALVILLGVADVVYVLYIRIMAPPMLLLTGEADTTVKPRNTRALAAALDALGAEVQTAYYPGMDHSDPLVATSLVSVPVTAGKTSTEARMPCRQ